MNNQPILNAYWWKGPPRNFGDLLSPVVLNHFSNIRTRWNNPARADIVSIGSVLDVLPSKEWTGIVAGSGKLHRDKIIDLTRAKVLGVRGKLTAAAIKTSSSSYALGDPGLLASEMVTVERGKYDIGVVPHWTDTELFPREQHNAKRYRYGEVTYIDPTQDPLEVIRMIGSCRRIVGSSLHAIIVADSFSIPRRTEMFKKMESIHEGGIFKFEDYASSIEQPIEFGKLQWAPKDRVETMQSELFDMLTSVPSELKELR